MALILDTYNVVHAGKSLGGAWAGLTVRKLCQWVMQSPRRQKTTLVIDGRAKPDEPSINEFPEVAFVYSGAGISADKVIGQMIERSRNRRNLTVVTNDRAVAEHARRHFAGAIACETFLNSLLGDTQNAGIVRRRGAENKSGGVKTPGEVEHWLKEFGIDAPAEPPKPGGEENVDWDRMMGGGKE